MFSCIDVITQTVSGTALKSYIFLILKMAKSLTIEMSTASFINTGELFVLFVSLEEWIVMWTVTDVTRV